MTTYELGDIIVDGKGEYWHYDDEDVEPDEPGMWIGYGGEACLPLSDIPGPHRLVQIIDKDRYDTLVDNSNLLFALMEKGVREWPGFNAAVDSYNRDRALFEGEQ